jgi:RNA polymerase sigma factor (sigma-70 family)
MVPRDVADDIVAEAFAKVLAVIRAGGGPSHAFGGYLLTAVRNLASDWLQARRRLTAVGDMDVATDDRTAAGRGRVTPGIGSAAETQAEARDEARLVVRAFARLPARWRAVLWQLEVEGKAPAAVAPMFGLSANGVSALAMRAREGLRQAYLEEHVGANVPAQCRIYAAEFGAGARGRLSRRRRAAMQEHLGHCPSCQDLFTELTELNSRLGAILTPAALAAASAALRTGRHTAMIRTGLTAPWRTWRLHPVTAAAGAAAGAAVAGGMLFAVNVTPVISSPALIAARPTDPAAPAAAASAPAITRRGHNGSGGGAGPGSLAGTGTPAPPGSPPGTDPLPGTGSLPSVTPRSAPAPSNQPAAASSPPSPAAPNTPAPTQANPIQTIASAASTTATTLTSTVSTTVSDVTSAASTTVNTLTTTVTTTVSGVASTTVASVASTASAAVSGVASTASGTVASVADTTGTTVSGVASAASATVASVADTTGTTVSGVASTVVAPATNTGTASTPPSALTTTAPGSASAATATASKAVATATGL